VQDGIRKPGVWEARLYGLYLSIWNTTPNKRIGFFIGLISPPFGCTMPGLIAKCQSPQDLVVQFPAPCSGQLSPMPPQASGVVCSIARLNQCPDVQRPSTLPFRKEQAGDPKLTWTVHQHSATGLKPQDSHSQVFGWHMPHRGSVNTLQPCGPVSRLLLRPALLNAVPGPQCGPLDFSPQPVPRCLRPVGTPLPRNAGWPPGTHADRASTQDQQGLDRTTDIHISLVAPWLTEGR